MNGVQRIEANSKGQELDLQIQPIEESARAALVLISTGLKQLRDAAERAAAIELPSDFEGSSWEITLAGIVNAADVISTHLTKANQESGLLGVPLE